MQLRAQQMRRGYMPYHYQHQLPPVPQYRKVGSLNHLHNPPELTDLQVQQQKQRAFHSALDQQMRSKDHVSHHERKGEVYDMRTENSATSLSLGRGSGYPPRYTRQTEEPMHYGHLQDLYNPPDGRELVHRARARDNYANDLNKQLQEKRSAQQQLQLPQISQPAAPRFQRHRRHTFPSPEPTRLLSISYAVFCLKKKK
eukprot:TRINITY_DN51464_c0_g2_i1.p1 TRINITY_DN51464_c0_g2~~TRINITY_DN51464_c0_g2_i1.p1  ORF type:complete len:199 (+),score=49.79 TRINITY_DN51464_c0_g2_i1:236-832(+)